MKKILVKATAVSAALAIGLFAAGCAAPNAAAPDNGGAPSGQEQGQGNGNGQGGSNGGQNNGANGQGKGQGNGQGNGKVEDNWNGNDVAEAPTVSDLGSFTASTIDGGTFSASDLANKDITIVNFWSTTCPPCVAEMPDLAEIQRELPANVQLITVLLDGQSGVQEAQSILNQAGYRGVTLVSDGNSSDLIAAVSDIMYMPTTVLYDSQGVALSEFIGGQSDLEDTIENAVNHQLSIMGKSSIDL